nr:somatomedin-B and thrombospondin type-1 domain-containing protein [Vulpes vulpes]
MRTLWMALCALARLWPGSLAGCADAGRCCPGRDAACSARGWRLDRVYGTCYCDQACRRTGDCCFDYARACPEAPPVDGQTATTAVERFRHRRGRVGRTQEKNQLFSEASGAFTRIFSYLLLVFVPGSPSFPFRRCQFITKDKPACQSCSPPCPSASTQIFLQLGSGDWGVGNLAPSLSWWCTVRGPLHLGMGVLETGLTPSLGKVVLGPFFWLHVSNALLSFLVPAFITTSAFNKERTRQAASPQWSTDTEDAGYCMEFKTESLTHHCALENRPLTRWMQYLREGYTVCVDCQRPAMNSVSLRCSGDGLDSDGNQTLHWQAIGNPRCQGTWKKVRRVDQCSCPAVHSFIFI